MLLLYIVLAVLVAFYLNWLYGRYHSTWKHIARFPGPIGLPYVGNAFQIGTTPEAHCRIVRCWVQKYKFEAFRIYGGGRTFIFLSNARHFENILSSTTLLDKADLYFVLRPVLGQGLLTSSGEHWAKHRKMITPSFHFQILQDFLQIINDTGDKFMSALADFAEPSKIFDFYQIVGYSTLDIISECAMGYKLNSLDGGNSPIIKAMHELTYITSNRVFNIFQQSDLLFRMSSAYRAQENALAIMRKELIEIISTRRKIIDERETETKEENTEDVYSKRSKMAFLDNLLTARIDGMPLSFQDIFEEVITFIFEGQDTAASALGFIVYCLSRHPEVQEKAFLEQYNMFGSDTKLQPTSQDLNDMKYLEMIIKETLRLFPSAPVIGRCNKTDIKLDDYTIPAGTNIFLSLLDAGVNPEYFEAPHEFRPERFDPNCRENINTFAYVPFSAGPRNCIGQKFAMMVMKSTMSNMLRKFVILPAVDGLGSGLFPPHVIPKNPYDAKLAFSITLKATNGIQIRLQNRLYGL